MTTRRHIEEHTINSLISKDGTTIGYRQLGQGPGIVLIHGAMVTSQDFMQLGRALARQFTVYIPDRRGRGLSGPFGEGYCIQKEIEDLESLLTETGATNVFGVSAGGLIALQAARTLPSIQKIALYEPALLMKGSGRTDWLERYDREMEQGNVAAALITSMIGLQLGPSIFNIMPRRLLEFITKKSMESEDKKAKEGELTMRVLAPTLHYEGQLLEEMTGTMENYIDLHTDVLLLEGSKGLPYLKPALEKLNNIIPNSKLIEFSGLDHAGACDVNNMNRSGKPEVVAQELLEFFV